MTPPTETPIVDALYVDMAWRSPDKWVTQIEVLTDKARELERLCAEFTELVRPRVKHLREFADFHKAIDMLPESDRTYLLAGESALSRYAAMKSGAMEGRG